MTARKQDQRNGAAGRRIGRLEASSERDTECSSCLWDERGRGVDGDCVFFVTIGDLGDTMGAEGLFLQCLFHT